MSLRRNRRAKIVATLGPASSDRDTLRSLFHAGVDVFRLNFSHGSAEITQSAWPSCARSRPRPAAPSA